MNMNRKKLTALLFSALLAVSVFAGCGGKQSDTEGGTGQNQEVSDAQPALSDVVQKVKDAYGEDYVPSMPIEEQQLTDVYSINMDNVEEFIAEGPMISAHVDTFIAIKAKEGKGEEVEKELKEYQKMVIDSSMQYPSNIAKVQSLQVVRHGDYVFYVLLGAFDDRTDVTEEQAAQFAQEQVQKGVDAINSCF